MFHVAYHKASLLINVTLNSKGISLNYASKVMKSKLVFTPSSVKLRQQLCLVSQEVGQVALMANKEHQVNFRSPHYS
jgi:hypothetical protein